MTKGPRRDRLTLLSAAALVLPSVFLSLVCLLSMADLILGWSSGTMTGPALCGLFLFPLPTLGVLYTEYQAIVRRRADAARLIGFLSIYVVVLSLFHLISGLLTLLGFLSRGPDSEFIWPDYGIFLVFVGCCLIIGLGHLRWGRILNAAKLAGLRDEWAGEIDRF